jgi:hypothetical protein
VRNRVTPRNLPHRLALVAAFDRLALLVPCRDADVIRTDHYRALGALGWKAPEGKKDPSQKKERDKGQQNKN